MTEEEKKEKATRIVDGEIEKLKGSFSACTLAMVREEMLEKMFDGIEKLQPKQQEKKEKLGAVKRTLCAVKSKFLK